MTVTGVKELNAKLKRMPAQVESRARDAMEKGADEIVAMMKRLVPVDDGDLRDSIGWTWGEPPKGSVTIGESRALKPGDLKLTIYAGNKKAYYARWVEFGTAPYTAGGEFAGAEVPARPAQPFFFPSYRALRARVKRRVITAARKALKEVAGSGK